MANISCGSTAPMRDVSAADQPWRRAFYSIEQIKALASISRTTIYREAQAGRLKLSRLVGRTGVMDDDFMEWLAMGEEIKRPPTGTTKSVDSGHTAPRPRKPGARHLPSPPRRGLPAGQPRPTWSSTRLPRL
jgi:hypothetical protein